MYKVGITGGIGSGKSTVARIFESIGIPVYYADKEAKRLMNKNQSLKQDIRILLSNQAYHKNGRLNRKYIAERVFKDKALLEQLNNLVHPAVRNDFESWAELQESSYVLEESALVFEIEGQSYFDATILVIADKETRIERVIKRDKSSN
jgi:dephospho-CoA kinase